VAILVQFALRRLVLIRPVTQAQPPFVRVRLIAYDYPAAQPQASPPDNHRMNWHDLDPGHVVLELPESPGRDRVELELHVFWDGGEPTRAVWLWSQSKRIAGWAVVGEA